MRAAALAGGFCSYCHAPYGWGMLDRGLRAFLADIFQAPACVRRHLRIIIMPSIRCPNCSSLLNCPDSAVNRRLRCGACGHRLAFMSVEEASLESARASGDLNVTQQNYASGRTLAALAGRLPGTVLARWLIPGIAGLTCLLLVASALMTSGRTPKPSGVAETKQEPTTESLQPADVVAASAVPEVPAPTPEPDPVADHRAVADTSAEESPAPREEPKSGAERGLDNVLKSVCMVRMPDRVGTGFLVVNRSLVATNFHVVEGHKEATAEFSDGTVIAVDGFMVASPEYDLAVLRLASDGPSDPLRIQAGQSDIGVDVFAVGNPKGLAGSVSKGVISARRRWVDTKPLFNDLIHFFGYDLNGKWVQTDAAVNKGNSGGPLCLADGTVIAINTIAATAEYGQNLNFAVDASHLLTFLERLPAKAMPLASLPRRPKPEAPPVAIPSDEAEKTSAYWNNMARIVATFYAEDIRIRAQAFGTPIPATEAQEKNGDPKGNNPGPQANHGGPVGLDDPMFGKTRTERMRRISRWAAEAGIGYEEALTMNFHALKGKKDSKKITAEAEHRERVRQNRLAPELRQFEWERRMQQANAADRKFLDLMTRQLAIQAAKAATALDALPSEGVNPVVVSFVIDVKASLRRLVLKRQRLHSVGENLLNAGPDAEKMVEGFQEANREAQQSEDLLDEVIYVAGDALRSRLSQLYGKGFGPVVQWTEEQRKLREAVKK